MEVSDDGAAPAQPITGETLGNGVRGMGIVIGGGMGGYSGGHRGGGGGGYGAGR